MKLVKEIKSKQGVLHFRRYRILETPIFNIYIHRIYMHDEDEHLHSHPWNMLVFVLNGSYAEEVKGEDKLVLARPMSCRFRSTKMFHKIKKVFSPVVTTLAFTFGKKVAWGYDVDGKFVDHESYRTEKNIRRLSAMNEQYEEQKRRLEELKKLLKIKSDDAKDIVAEIKKTVDKNEELKNKLKNLRDGH